MEAHTVHIDRQRVAAVSLPQALGYTWRSGGWQSPTGAPRLVWTEPDDMHALLVRHSDVLAGCTEGSEEKAELSALADVAKAYEANALAKWQGARRKGTGRRSAQMVSRLRGRGQF